MTTGEGWCHDDVAGVKEVVRSRRFQQPLNVDEERRPLLLVQTCEPATRATTGGVPVDELGLGRMGNNGSDAGRSSRVDPVRSRRAANAHLQPEEVPAIALGRA